MSKTASLLVIALVIGGGPLQAKPTFPDLGETTLEQYRRILETAEGFREKKKHAEPATARKKRILTLSEAILTPSASATPMLRHLRGIPGRIPAEAYEWRRFGEFEEDIAKSLMRKGLQLTPELQRRLGLIEGAMLWYEMQYTYDRNRPHRESVKSAGWLFQEPLEAELRARKAGCLFWEEGLGTDFAPGAEVLSDVFSCGEDIPPKFYCLHNFSVEYVLLAEEELRKWQRKKIRKTLKTLLAAYCAEFERTERGNPLSLKDFNLEWDKGQCLKKAVATVLAPGWISSLEACPALYKSGPDIREVALEIGKIPAK